MSKFEELFMAKKEKKTTPAPSPRKTTRTVQRKAEKSPATLTKDDLQTFKEDLLTSLKQTIPQPAEPSKIMQVGIIHTFNRENLIQFIGRRGKRGTKLCELRDYFFGSATTGEIDIEVQKLRKEELIQKNRSGWMSLRKR